MLALTIPEIWIKQMHTSWTLYIPVLAFWDSGVQVAMLIFMLMEELVNLDAQAVQFFVSFLHLFSPFSSNLLKLNYRNSCLRSHQGNAIFY